MKSPTKNIKIPQAVAYWEKNKRGLSPPFRYDWDPRETQSQFIIDCRAENTFKIRSAGILVEKLIGICLAGRGFPSLFFKHVSDPVKSGLISTIDEPGLFSMTITTEQKKYPIMFMPLRADSGPIEFAVGVIEIDKEPLHSSPLLGAEDFNFESIRHTPLKNASGFAEEPAGFKRQVRQSLRVIEGDRHHIEMLSQNKLSLVKSIKREP